MRNERSYNSSLGPTRVGAIQTPVSVAPKTARVSRPPLRIQTPDVVPWSWMHLRDAFITLYKSLRVDVGWAARTST